MTATRIDGPDGTFIVVITETTIHENLTAEQADEIIRKA